MGNRMQLAFLFACIAVSEAGAVDGSEPGVLLVSVKTPKEGQIVLVRLGGQSLVKVFLNRMLVSVWVHFML